VLIYLLFNRVNEKIYVGQTVTSLRERWHQHVAHASRGIKNSVISAAIKKYGAESFERYVLVDGIQSRKGLNDAERLWITLLRATDMRFGYNIGLGGRDSLHSEETRRKISQTMKRKGIQPKESVRFMGNAANRGSKRSEAVRHLLSEKKRGKPSPLRGRTFPQFHGRHVHTEETKEKTRIRMTGNKFFLGRSHAEEAKKKIGDAQRGPLNHRFGKVAHNKGIPRTEDERRKMREGWARRKSLKAGIQPSAQAQLPAPGQTAAA
jgi:group I intron endonuclease